MGKNRKNWRNQGPKWQVGVLAATGLSIVLLLAVILPAVQREETAGGQRFGTWEQSSGEAISTMVDPNAPAISAKTAVVMDIVSGRILYEKNKDEKVYPASTTKIMTALLGIEQGQLDEMITVSGAAIGVEGSSIYLKEGEKISMEDLLYGAMLRSGNDAATAIAQAIGQKLKKDSVEDPVQIFVEKMNLRAAELGAVHTQFANPTGLHDENHYTTALDMALIGRAAMQNPTFSTIAGAESWMAERQEDRDPYFYNKNKVVHQYEGGTGVKIGYTKATGRTLVASSSREGMQLVCVVMNAPDWFNDAYRLMDYIYETCQSVEIAAAGQRISQVNIEGGVRNTVWVGVKEPVSCIVRRGEESNLGVACAVREPVKAPVQRGQEAGQLHIYASGQYVYSVPLYFFEDVDSGQ